MDFKTRVKQVDNIVTDSCLEWTDINIIKQKLAKIKLRIDDPNLYVGIIGEFSSGKSTLINCFIGADYFVTNSIQGTTTCVTSIRYGKFTNLSIKYKNGELVKYSNDKLKLIERYLPKKYNALSAIDKLKIKTGDFLGMNQKDEFMLEIFDTITTSNELSEQLEEVMMYFPSDFLKGGIVLLDTPGTDSLNPEHTRITERALAEKCDLALVIIPSNTPLSLTLSYFVEENLHQCIEHCYFLLTKVELLHSDCDRVEMIDGLRIRIQNFLDINDPRIIMAPTLLSLEERTIVDKTNILNHLSQAERNSLVKSFDKEVEFLFSDIVRNKNAVKNNTLQKMFSQLHVEVMDKFTEKKLILTNNLDTLREKMVMPLDTFFKQSFDIKILTDAFELVVDRIKFGFERKKQQLIANINSQILAANSKDKVQGIMSTQNTIGMCIETFKECFEISQEQLTYLISTYKDSMSELQRTFEKHYSLTMITYAYSEIKGITQQGYNEYFSKWPLTTFPLFRCFIGIQTIKNEMINAVRKRIDSDFERLLKNYLSIVTYNNKYLQRQIQTIIKKNTYAHAKVVRKRMEKESKEEEIYINSINKLSQQMEQLCHIKDMTHDSI